MRGISLFLLGAILLTTHSPLLAEDAGEDLGAAAVPSEGALPELGQAPPAVARRSGPTGEGDWSVDVGFGGSPFVRNTSYPGILDRQRMFNFPIDVNYRLAPTWQITTGIEVQWYTATNSNPYNYFSSLNAVALRIPLVLDYVIDAPNSLFFALIGAGVAVGVPISYSYYNQYGMPMGNYDVYGNYYRRSRTVVQDIVQFGVGMRLGSLTKLKLICDWSPISMMSNPVLVSTSPYMVPDPSQSYYLGYSTFVINLRAELFSF